MILAKFAFDIFILSKVVRERETEGKNCTTDATVQLGAKNNEKQLKVTHAHCLMMTAL